MSKSFIELAVESAINHVLPQMSEVETHDTPFGFVHIGDYRGQGRIALLIPIIEPAYILPFDTHVQLSYT